MCTHKPYRCRPNALYDWHGRTHLSRLERDHAAAPRGEGGDGACLGDRRQSVLGACRGPRGAAAGRGGARRGRDAVGAEAQNVIFTSGGTEANALALTPGLRRGKGPAIERLLVSAIEHASVLAGGRFAADASSHIGVTRDGVVDLDRLRALLDGEPPRWSPSCSPTTRPAPSSRSRSCRDRPCRWRGLLHVDAIQALGKIPFDLASTGADLLTLSAHKIGGPKGVGALVLAEGVEGLAPHAARRRSGEGPAGGHRECRRHRRLRSGRQSGAGGREGDAGRDGGLRVPGSKRVSGQTPGAVIFADEVKRLPNTVLFAVPGMRAETAVIGFDLAGIAVSSGSACSSGKVQPSHVVEAMGYGAGIGAGSGAAQSGLVYDRGRH